MSVSLVSAAQLPTGFGSFTIHIFRDDQGTEHMALASGAPADGCLVRLHSECATGDIFGSLRCDCRNQLETSLRHIAAAGGVLVYLRGHEGRGIGLGNKIKAYALQEQGHDTAAANTALGFPADARSYEAAVDILKHFGLSRIRLLTNNPRKMAALAENGIDVAERVGLWTAANPHNATYLDAKLTLLHHLK